MDKGKVGLTVFFEEPFWVGVFERVEDGKLSICGWFLGVSPGVMRCGILSPKIITA